MRIVYLTAGAAGMYCGSCLHDNGLAKALIQRGHDALLVPVYTPITTDQTDVSQPRLFYGGLNVYLQQLSPLFRWLPAWSDAFLNSPKLVGWIASRAMGTSAANLGALTVSMLRGAEGRQRKEVVRMGQWLKSLAPDAIIFSNLLIAGSAPWLRDQLPDSRLVVMLQGDDIFYNGLIEPYRSQALTELRRLARQVDLMLLHSRQYQQRMSQLLQVPESRMVVCPLSVDSEDLLAIQRSANPTRPPAVGFLARLAPEKGLHQLVDAFIQLKQGQSLAPKIRLEIAGWLGAQQRDYWQQQQEKLERAGLRDDYRYWGIIDRQSKIEFLSNIDLLSVPTTHPEPKGLFVLEALAAGVPYLLPAHGAFPELHARAGMGKLHQPDSVSDLADNLQQMLGDVGALRAMSDGCREFVRQQATADLGAASVEQALKQLMAT
ncbi:MAG: glycosyltransferase family 4 protein [Pirellulaceae bacterium]|nr:glycosyltransferase family 4 protein [Pirellulaceae bacterium]